MKTESTARAADSLTASDALAGSFPVGTPAYREWHCGVCGTGMTHDSNLDALVCEVCGCRYDSETGAYLGGRGRSRL